MRAIKRSRSQQRAPGSTRYNFRISRRQPILVIGVLVALFLSYLIIAPIVSILSDGVRVHYGDDLRAEQPFGSFTTYYFERVFTSDISSSVFWGPLLHTLEVSIGAIVVALVVGGLLGWFFSRTNLVARKWFATALIIPYMVPSWTFAMAWFTIFRNRTTGGQQGWLEAIGIEPPNWIAYGQFPITFILALHYMPFVILLFGGALRNFDSQLEEAARTLGAKPHTVALRIIIPLMRPSLLSATILIFAKCLGDFGVTYILGTPVGYNVLATSLFREVSAGQPGSTAILAGAIVLIGAVSLAIDARLVRGAKRFVTIGSKSKDSPSQLGRWGGIAAATFTISVFIVGVAVPLMVLFLTTIMRIPGRFELSNFTSDFWIGENLSALAVPQGLLRTPEFWNAAWNTLWIVGLAALAAGIMGQIVGYIVARTSANWLGLFLRQVTFLPYLIPGIALAAAFLSLFAVQRGPIPALYGTPLILLLAIMVDQLPYASRAGITSMVQLGKEHEEAAAVSGLSWIRRVVKVVIPIQKRALVTGSLLPFISGIKGLSLVVLLAVPGTDLLTTFTIRLVDYGYTQTANAAILMLCLLAFVATYTVQKVTGTGLAQGLGSR